MKGLAVCSWVLVGAPVTCTCTQPTQWGPGTVHMVPRENCYFDYKFVDLKGQKNFFLTSTIFTLILKPPFLVGIHPVAFHKCQGQK